MTSSTQGRIILLDSGIPFVYGVLASAALAIKYGTRTERESRLLGMGQLHGRIRALRMKGVDLPKCLEASDKSPKGLISSTFQYSSVRILHVSVLMFSLYRRDLLCLHIGHNPFEDSC